MVSRQRGYSDLDRKLKGPGADIGAVKQASSSTKISYFSILIYLL